MAHTAGVRSRVLIATAAAGISLVAGCGSKAEPPSFTTPSNPGPSGSSTGPMSEITAVCPLVNMETVTSTFRVANPKATEKAPVNAAPRTTTYACDFRDDNGALFLTVGIVVGPPSGTAAANVRAALDNNDGEPVADIGEVGGYHEKDGVATVAGIKKAGVQWRLLVVYGAAGSKNALVAIARHVAPKI